MSNDSNITNTGSGILVGVDPAQPRTQESNYQPQQPRPDQAVSQPVVTPVVQPPPQPQPRFTEEDIERARQQEKDKLYGRIEELSTGLKSMQEERQAEQAERQRLAEEAEAARRAKEEGEMEVRDLIAKREQEWTSQIEELKTRFDADRAVFEKERYLQEIAVYRRDRIEQEEQFLLPELRQFITGSSPEEVDNQIEEMKRMTEQIVSNVAAAYQPQPFRGGAMPSVPPVGPMEQLPEHQQLTPEMIRDMDMKTYERYREQLLPATNPNRRGR